MTSPQDDLDQFLRDLSGRRVRLLGLVGSDSGGQTALVDELNDLGEQLIVADEELRVQQEELDDARRQVESMRTERAQFFDSATEAWVLTDERGLVLRTTRAADRLALLPAARLKPRPIPTWFDVGDRGAVRRMIGRSAGNETQELDRAMLRRPDGTTVAVRVSLTRTLGDPGPATQLRWALTRQESPTPHLRLVGSPQPTADPEAMAAEFRLSAGLVAMVGRLAQRQPLQDAWSTILADATALVDGVDHVGLVLFRRRGPGHPLAASDASAAAADLAQLELGGPLTATLADNWPNCLTDTEQSSSWPEFGARAAALGIRSVLTVPMTVPSHLTDLGQEADQGAESTRPARTAQAKQHVGALCLYSDVPGALDDAERAASLLAAHAAVGLIWLNRESGLQDALVSRQLIGEAVGVLVERRKLTSGAAFDVLVRRSQDANLKLRELARIVVETGQDPSEITAP